MKNTIKIILYYSGLLTLFHRFNNRKVLTVVVFHRVISDTDYRWQQIDKEWTVTDVFFKKALSFFKKKYSPVSLENVIEASKGKLELPSCPLLITFDDGWKDNYDYAYPCAKELNIPITIFCTTGAINNTYLNWREIVYALSHMNKEKLIHIFDILEKHGITHQKEMSGSEIISIIQISNKKETIIKEVNNLIHLLGSSKQMLNDAEIIEMKKSNVVSFGSHGHTHEPLMMVDNPEFELKESKDILSTLLNEKVESMAYPHSSVDSNIHTLANKIGYRFQFGGRNNLNIISKNEARYFFARIVINQLDLSRGNGNLAPELLSLLLFRSKHRTAIF